MLYIGFKKIGVVYCIAYISLIVQFDGLYGTYDYFTIKNQSLDAIQSSSISWWLRPHIFLSSSDVFFWIMLVCGFVFSLCMIIGLIPFVSSLLTWAIYLSFINTSQVFLHFQWDILLCEIGFLTIFYLH